MATNIDILAFLKSDREARAKEKEGEKVARARERDEDMQRMEKMLKNAVKMEVLAALQPLEERIDRQEKASKEMDKQFSIMMKEVEDLKLTISKYPTSSVQAMAAVGERFGMEGMESREDLTLRERAMDKKERVMQNNLRNTKDMCAAARKVVGFGPIEPRMLRMQMEGYGAKDLEEAMLMEIKS